MPKYILVFWWLRNIKFFLYEFHRLLYQTNRVHAIWFDLFLPGHILFLLLFLCAVSLGPGISFRSCKVSTSLVILCPSIGPK